MPNLMRVHYKSRWLLARITRDRGRVIYDYQWISGIVKESSVRHVPFLYQRIYPTTSRKGSITTAIGRRSLWRMLFGSFTNYTDPHFLLFLVVLSTVTTEDNGWLQWNKQEPVGARKEKRVDLHSWLPTESRRRLDKNGVAVKGSSLRLRLAFHFGTVRRMNFNTALTPSPAL